MNIQLLIIVFSFVMLIASVVIVIHNSLKEVRGKYAWYIVLIASSTIFLYALCNGGKLW